MQQVTIETRVKHNVFDAFILGLSVMFAMVISNVINTVSGIDGVGTMGIVTTVIVFAVAIILGVNREKRLNK